ncbi:MAG TPA: superoxide dismutase family protein [Gemmatimonadaceae bacterium]|jgi:Cu-Zn family superoxide dismutase|nr:superoxide dismutase family protein [Gemmatimonadaceae bacterium]
MARWTCFAIAAAVIGSGCASTSSAGSDAPGGTFTLRDASGREVGSGEVSTAEGGGVRVRLNATGLTPGVHGVHVHGTGACDGSTSTPFSSAGGHHNPTGRQHGRLNPEGPHAGDLPNLTVDASGNGTLDTVNPNLTLGDGAGSVLDTDGSAIVIHANPDDERTNDGPNGPGNSGSRVACGVITRR